MRSAPSADPPPADRDRVAILNGFGRTIGDGIIGLQALSVALAGGAMAPHPVLFRLPGLPPLVQAVHAAAGFAAIRDLPWSDETPARPFAGAAGFGRVIDLRDFAFDPEFQRVPMIDFFLHRLGVDPATVPAAERRNTWLRPFLPPLPLRARAGARGADAGSVPTGPSLRPPPAGGEGDYALVCPRTSMALRDMPAAIHDHILDRLSRSGPVLTQGEVPAPLAGRVTAAPAAETLEALCGLVAAARRVISTDTAMVHLADAFAVPCLAFFPTHRPEWRMRDYPLCTAVALRSALPEGIEFARDDADLALARAAWFPDGDDLRWLDQAIEPADTR